MKLKPNLGNLDMVLRIMAGVALILLMAVGEIGAWGLVGLALAVTGAARYCPLYAAFGLSTAKKLHHAAEGHPAGK